MPGRLLFEVMLGNGFRGVAMLIDYAGWFFLVAFLGAVWILFGHEGGDL